MAAGLYYDYPTKKIATDHYHVVASGSFDWKRKVSPKKRKGTMFWLILAFVILIIIAFVWSLCRAARMADIANETAFAAMMRERGQR